MDPKITSNINRSNRASLAAPLITQPKQEQSSYFSQVSRFSCLFGQKTHPVDINAQDEQSCTTLMRAASKGDFHKVKRLILQEADINLKVTDNWNAIHYSLTHPQILRLLLENGASYISR